MATPPSLASKSFYKRPLPPSCTPFNSQEGRTVFKHALDEGHLDSYFLLSQHFLTQNEPAYCALGTLAMVLNALEMDPQRVWKGAWRFYDQDMLDCCRPLSDIAEVGLTLAEFACLARCNGLRATVVSPRIDNDDNDDGEVRQQDLARFRHDLARASTGHGTIAFSYSRKALGQTGTGHFSPIAAYSHRDDKVLILDVARFKYPSYWIPVELAYDAMRPIDEATGQPRGYVVLDVAPSRDVGTLAGKQSLTTLTLNKSSWAALSNSLSRILLETPKSATLDSLLVRLTAHLANLPTPAVVSRPPPPPPSFLPDASDTAYDSPAPSRPPSPSLVVPSLGPPPPALDSILDALGSSRLPAAPRSNPLVSLLLLALFSPRSSLLALVPPHLAPTLRESFDDATTILGSSKSLASSSVGESTGAAAAAAGAGSAARATAATAAAAAEVEKVLKDEVEFLTRQLGALGECCRAEEQAANANTVAASCGCASKK